MKIFDDWELLERELPSDFQTTLPTVRSLLPTVMTTLPTVMTTLQTVITTLPTVMTTLPIVITTPQTAMTTPYTVMKTMLTVLTTILSIMTTLPTVTTTILTIMTTLPTIMTTLPTIMTTLPTVLATLPIKMDGSAELTLTVPGRSYDDAFMPDRHVLLTLKLKKPIVHLCAQATSIVAAVGDPAHATWFGSLSALLPPITTAVAALQQAHTLALTKVMGAVAARGPKEDELRELLRVLAGRIQSLMNANPIEAKPMLAASGFGERAVGTRSVPVLAVKQGTKLGTATWRAKAGPRGKRVFYEVHYSLDGGKTWMETQGSNYAHGQIEGLPTATEVEFEVQRTVGGVTDDWHGRVTLLVR